MKLEVREHTNMGTATRRKRPVEFRCISFLLGSILCMVLIAMGFGDPQFLLWG